MGKPYIILHGTHAKDAWVVASHSHLDSRVGCGRVRRQLLYRCVHAAARSCVGSPGTRPGCAGPPLRGGRGGEVQTHSLPTNSTHSFQFFTRTAIFVQIHRFAVFFHWRILLCRGGLFACIQAHPFSHPTLHILTLITQSPHNSGPILCLGAVLG